MAADEPVLRRAEVVFMYASTDEAYKAYGATFVAWGGANTPKQVERHHALGIRCTGSMWCLTSGAELIHKDPKLRAACAVDIAGKPVEVPWLFDHTYEGTKSYFGCTNHPDFRALCRERVRQAMSGGADGLHVDDHLGVANPAAWGGGGLCNHCVEAFRRYLKAHATEEQLRAAGVTDLDNFDYRTLVRKYATTREQYKKMQKEIPLNDLFLEFHAQAAAEHCRDLGKYAEQVAGHPVLLSANAGLPNPRHTYVVKYLTHVVCEVNQKAYAGTSDIEHAVEAYALATQLGKPLAATASGGDWAYVKEHNCEELVRFWIALAYAHGQRFMVPHPKKQWCFNKERGTHWYEAPVSAYAPVYRFVRENAEWLDGFESLKSEGLAAPERVHCTLRRHRGKSALALHVLNRDYDPEAMRMRPMTDVRISLPKRLVGTEVKKGTAFCYDCGPAEVAVDVGEQAVEITLPKLRLWSVIALE